MVRQANRRGEGERLRHEIMAAAVELLSRAGAGHAVTLRAIARQAGIAAPSIYAHFADRDAVLDAVVVESFTELAALAAGAGAGLDAPADRLRAICAAYVAFGRDHPGRYRLLFERSEANLSAAPQPYDEGIAAFSLLSDTLARCIADGTSSSTDPMADSVALWAALHGMVTLPRTNPGFHWPPDHALLERTVTGLARLVE